MARLKSALSAGNQDQDSPTPALDHPHDLAEARESWPPIEKRNELL